MLTEDSTKNESETQSHKGFSGLIYTDSHLADLMSDCPALHAVLPFTLFPDRRGLRVKEKRESLIDLSTHLSTAPADSKEEQPHFKMGTFGEVKSDKGSYRTNANFQTVTGVEGDYDAGNMTPDQAAEALSKAGVAAVIVTSASHGVSGKGQRWRVVCPLSTTVKPDARAALAARLNGALGGVLSDELFTPVTSYGYGHVEGRAAPEVRVIEGRFLDDCGDLDAGAIGKPSKVDLGDPQPALDQSDDPAALVHAQNRLEAQAARLADMGPGDNRNGTLNAAAFEMGGLVACSTLDKADVIEALTAAADECGYCQEYGEDDAVRVLELGLKRGMLHPTPHVGLADQLDDLPDEDNAAVGSYAPDQDGAIRAYTDQHRQGMRFDHDRATWLEFDGHTWRPERTDLARDFARQVCMTFAKRHRKEGKGLRHVGVWESVERGARSVRDFAVTSTYWGS